jgi:hypothetical protein
LPHRIARVLLWRVKSVNEEKGKEFKEIDILKSIVIELRVIRQELEKANQLLSMFES